MVVAFLLLGVGGMVLVSEGGASSQLEDMRAGFANGDGLVAERDTESLLNVLVTDDSAKLGAIIELRLAEQPFDPFLLSLKAKVLVDQDMLASARLLDQALAIAPRDPRLRALRGGLQTWLRNAPFPSSQSAE